MAKMLTGHQPEEAEEEMTGHRLAEVAPEAEEAKAEEEVAIIMRAAEAAITMRVVEAAIIMKVVEAEGAWTEEEGRKPIMEPRDLSMRAHGSGDTRMRRGQSTKKLK